MAPAASTMVFIAGKMTSLLKEIDSNVRVIVYEAKKQGAEVQHEVKALLQKYLDLLKVVILRCRDLKDFTEASKTSLEDIEKILTLVLDGSVSDVLKEIRMQRYVSNFEDKDLTNAYQLLKDNFDIKHVKLHTDEAKETILGKVEALRNNFSTIAKRLKEVKEKGDECDLFCKDITEKFNTFMKEIEETQKETQKKMAGPLKWQHFKKTALCSSAYAVIGLAFALLVIGTAGLMACAFGCDPIKIADMSIPVVTAAAVGWGGGVTAGIAGYFLHDQKEASAAKMDDLKKLQKLLNEMSVDAYKQKTAWELDVDDRMGRVMKLINNPSVGKNADDLKPSGGGAGKPLLETVQSLRKEVQHLEDNVERFEKEAQSTLDNLQDISLMKESDTVSAPPEKPTKSPYQLFQDFITDLEEAIMNSKMGNVCTQAMAALQMVK